MLKPAQGIHYIYATLYEPTSKLLERPEYISTREIFSEKAVLDYLKLIERCVSLSLLRPGKYHVRLFRPDLSAPPNVAAASTRYDEPSHTFWLPHRRGDFMTEEGLSALLVLIAREHASRTLTSAVGAVSKITSILLRSFIYEGPTESSE